MSALRRAMAMATIACVVCAVCGHSQMPSRAQAQSIRSTASHSKSMRTRAVTGPAESMNGAIAVGATATITFQPVPPKTVPASDYPPGSSISGQTITLGSVPARVWIEIHVTAWFPQARQSMTLLSGDVSIQVKVDATDEDGDGGGYDGNMADCMGSPALGAGDLFPAIQPCTAHADCRSTISGIVAACLFAEPSKCIPRPPFFPPGGPVCEFAFIDKCDSEYVGTGIPHVGGVDLNVINTRWGHTPEPPHSTPDFGPSYLGTLVLDIPADAKGAYEIDFNQLETFILRDANPPNNNIPIAALNPAIIDVGCGSCCTNLGPSATCTDGLSQFECAARPSSNGRIFRRGITCDQQECCCETNSDCDDNDVCTVDACDGVCLCTHTPVAGFSPATECCHPLSGAQAARPATTSCQTGGCSLGGGSGVPVTTYQPDGSFCEPSDPCYLDGQCLGGVCTSEQHAGFNCPKVRFVSFDVESGSVVGAYRIRLVSLHRPDPPYTADAVADFTSYEGQVRWVGEAASYAESTADPTPLFASLTQCDPFYSDWSGIDLLHVTGAEIVPSSIYEIQFIAEGLDVEVESNYSAPVTVMTSRWGEAVIPYSPPSLTTQPDTGDTAALVHKFRSSATAISKPRALLSGMGPAGIPNLAGDVSFAEISSTLDAFRGQGYPYAGPQPCP